MLGDFLPTQLIYKGKTPRCHPHYQLPPGWQVTHSPNHWSTEATMLEYVEHIIIPYVEKVRKDVGDKPALAIVDNFKGQVTDSVSSLLELHNFMCATCLLIRRTVCSQWTLPLLNLPKSSSSKSLCSGTQRK